jgi:ABC-type branched-subunit amino acid transport system substrate-binding protein
MPFVSACGDKEMQYGRNAMPSSSRLILAATFAVSVTLSGSASAADKIKIGFFSTLEGPYTALGEDGQRGFDLAVMQHHNKAGGKDLEIIRGSSDASPDSALRAAKKLVEQDKIDILIAPLSGSEGIALRDYAKTQPQITVINGCSGALETTYVTPAPNFFRFNIDGAQMHKGLGQYIYNVKHYKKIATIGEDYSFVYTQVFGLALDYCPLGGQITKRIWVPLGTKDFSSVISSLPDDVDAIYLGLGGADALNFLNQYQQAGGNAKLFGGTIMIDQTILSSKGKAKEALIGTASASSFGDTSDDPKWQAFVKAYKDSWPPEKRFPSPSLCAVHYYDETAAALLALDKVNGDLSDGHKKFREALATLVLDAPNGQIKLDENRQAIGTTFVTEVVRDSNGDLVSKVVQVVPNVDQRLGFSKEVFDRIGLPAREVPVCKKNYD